MSSDDSEVLVLDDMIEESPSTGGLTVKESPEGGETVGGPPECSQTPKSTLPPPTLQPLTSIAPNVVHQEKKTFPFLYVQSNLMKGGKSETATTSETPVTIGKPTKIKTVGQLPNGVNKLVPVSGNANKLVPVSGNTNKLVPVSGNPNIAAYVGSLLKNANVKDGGISVNQKIVFTSMKGKDGSLKRLILPRSTAITSHSTSTPTTTKNLVVLPQGAGKKFCKFNFVTTPSQQTMSKSPQISILPRKAVLIDPQSAPTKLVQPNIIRQKTVDGKFITNTLIKPFNILPGKALVTVTSGTPNLNHILNSRPMMTTAKLNERPNTITLYAMETPKAEANMKSGKPSIKEVKDQVKMTNETEINSKSKEELKSKEQTNEPEKPDEKPNFSKLQEEKFFDLNLKEEKMNINYVEKTIVEKDKVEPERSEPERNIRRTLGSQEREVKDIIEELEQKTQDLDGSLTISTDKDNSFDLQIDSQEFDQDIEEIEVDTSELTALELNNEKDVSNKATNNEPNSMEIEEVSNGIGKPNKQDSDVTVIEDDGKQDNKKCHTGPENAQNNFKPFVKNHLVNGHADINSISEKSDVTNASSAVSKETVALPTERVRKRKGPVLVNELPVKVFAEQQENLALLPGAEDYDPFKTIEWDSNGIGVMPGCNIKMTMNQYGMIEVDEETLTERGCSSLTDTIEGKRKERDPDEIYCCISCSCYGLISEFYNENYCSIACRNTIIEQQRAICNKTEQEQPAAEVVEQKKKKKKTDTVKSNSDEDDTEKTEKVKPEKPVEKPPVQPVKQGIISVRKDIVQSFRKEPSSSEIINLDEDSNNSESFKAINEPLKVKKLTKPSYKMKNQLESIIENNRRLMPRADKPIANLRTIESVGKAVSSANRHYVAQDLDPGTVIEVKTRPGIRSEDGFPWGHYLSLTGSNPTWIRLFNNPFPDSANNFVPHTKLEAIDPEHQSLFCAVSIEEIKGYRLKLHFEGYPYAYDFWVNADSPNIYPCGFCSQHGIQLQPPYGHNKLTFDWKIYHRGANTKPALTLCFPTFKINNVSQNLFKVGMKLEAVDRRNSFLVCVASVAGVIESRILIHFDSWDDMYDYWVDITSPYIHPPGWCKENNHELTPPNGIKPSEFSWETYLRKTRSPAAPAKAFCLRPFREFTRGTKLEAIDKRAPHLLRVATVVDILPYQIKIHFDGFPENFDYWVDDDSPDIHPVGWGRRTGHPVEEPPPSCRFLDSPCPTPGCLGDGNMKGLIAETHNKVSDCPYSVDNLNVEHHLTKRMADYKKFSRKYENEIIDLDKEDSENENEDESKKKRWSWIKVRAEEAKKRNEQRKVPLGRPPLNRVTVPEVEEESEEMLNESKLESMEIRGEDVTERWGKPSSKYGSSRKLRKPKVENMEIAELDETERSEKNVAKYGSGKRRRQSRLESITIAEDETERSEKSVERKQTSPERQPKSPERKEETPERREKTPERREKTPERKEKTPERIEKTPEGKEKTPERKENTPERIEEKLEKKSEIPEMKVIENCSIKVEVKREFDAKEEPKDENKDEIKMEENVDLIESECLHWSVDQVSDFARSMLSDSIISFANEGIDGEALMMLTKADLIDIIGLNVNQAHRFSERIDSLRCKVNPLDVNYE